MNLLLDQGRSPASRTRVLLLSVLCAGAFAFGPAVAAEIPSGVFCLLPAGTKCADATLSNPNVDGLSLRQDWAALEPTEGIFDWSFFDSEVARAAAAGKQVLLRVLTQSGKPSWVTAAVAKAGGSFYTFDDNGVETTIPVFWDPTFLAKKKAMIAALGAHFSGNPAIKIVAVSFANATSEDWNVPHTPSEITAWFDAGYSTEKMLATGSIIINAAMAAFPNQYVTLAVGGSGHVGATGNLDPDASYVARNVIATARASWPGRLIVQKNSLATFTPPAPGTDTLFQVLWDSRPDVAGQMLDACFGDTTYRNNAGVPDDAASILHRAVDAGVAYGMKYIEIYQKDVLNLPAEISYAHSVLWSAGGSIAAPKPPSHLRTTP